MTRISTQDIGNVLESELMAVLPHLRAFAICLARNRDRADDLVQDSIVRALGAAHRFQPGTNLKSWMFTILRNVFYNDFRKNKLALSLDSLALPEPQTPASQESCLEFGDFRRAFWQLTADKREVLILVGVSGLTYDEAARVCGCAKGTIKSRVSRARDDLWQILENGLLAGKRRDTLAIAGGLGDLLIDLPELPRLPDPRESPRPVMPAIALRDHLAAPRPRSKTPLTPLSTRRASRRLREAASSHAA